MRWTREQTEYLEENWGSVRVKTIAENVGRSENSVLLKAKRMGLGGCYSAGNYLSANAVAEMLKVDNHTVTDYWIAKCGLKAKKKALIEFKTWIIKHEDLIKWLKANTDKWDSRKIELYALGEEPQWLQEKRKADRELPAKRFVKWTREEEKLLISYVNMGLTQKEIAERFGRTKDAIERKTHRLREKGELKSIKVIVPWTEQEKNILISMDKQSKQDEEIAWELGREVDHVRYYRRELRKKGLYTGYKSAVIAREETKKIKELKKQGLNGKEIASILGVHPTTITRRLKQYA